MSDDMDELMEMSDAELDRELATAMREHNEWWATLTPLQQYRVSRRRVLGTALRWRKLIREHELPFMQEHLRRSQRRLLALRIERRTGIAPGNA